MKASTASTLSAVRWLARCWTVAALGLLALGQLGVVLEPVGLGDWALWAAVVGVAWGGPEPEPRLRADGIHDDTAALRWRVRRGLPIPPGTYLVDSQLIGQIKGSSLVVGGTTMSSGGAGG